MDGIIRREYCIIKTLIGSTKCEIAHESVDKPTWYRSRSSQTDNNSKGNYKVGDQGKNRRKIFKIQRKKKKKRKGNQKQNR